MSLDQQRLKKAFDTFDIDKSGAISTSELCTVLNQCGVKVSQAQCSLLIQNYDANESGLMEFAEFQDLFKEALAAQGRK